MRSRASAVPSHRTAVISACTAVIAVLVTEAMPPDTQHISQIDGVERARAALVDAGADVHLHRFHGGHTFAPWRAELADALRWLARRDAAG